MSISSEYYHIGDDILFKMNKRVILLLRGGLGNQLFQICNVAVLSGHHEALFYISDLNTFHLQRGMGGTESLSLTMSSVFPANKPPHILKSNSRPIVRCLVGASNRFGLPKLFVEKLDSFCDLPRLSLLTGYFQNFKIVDQIPIDLLNLAILGELIKPDFPKITDRVCIHVRRQDYPQSISKNFGIDYYAKAVRKFQDLGFRKFDCYSDDLSAAQNIFSFLPERQKSFPESKFELNSISLLRKMAMYNNFVLSQSSLAWWASYIAFRNNPEVRIESQLPSVLNFVNR